MRGAGRSHGGPAVPRQPIDPPPRQCHVSQAASAAPAIRAASAARKCNVLDFCTALPSKTVQKRNVVDFCTPLTAAPDGLGRRRRSRPGASQAVDLKPEAGDPEKHSRAVQKSTTLQLQGTRGILNPHLRSDPRQADGVPQGLCREAGRVATVPAMRLRTSLEAPVYLAPMPDSEQLDDHAAIVDRSEDPIRPNAPTPAVFNALQLLCTGQGARIFANAVHKARLISIWLKPRCGSFEVINFRGYMDE